MLAEVITLELIGEELRGPENLLPKGGMPPRVEWSIREGTGEPILSSVLSSTPMRIMD